MLIRHSTEPDLPRIMDIYAHARAFMAETGNPRQWGPNHEGRVVGTFFFDRGTDVEPTYAHIDDGSWIGDDTYGVVHRIAADGTVPGTGSFCLEWAYAQCGHLRIDTHVDNTPMRNLLRKLGFVHCGTIYVHEDNDPRLAFERL